RAAFFITAYLFIFNCIKMEHFEVKGLFDEAIVIYIVFSYTCMAMFKGLAASDFGAYFGRFIWLRF
ncbi:hypothetical protein ACR9PT_09835, partial [Piscirickettsia salmonis]|uniref:hypothetical protein n=1 Tax=Piscirickettsia salmonis TaxID=1238 RepID=UPI003EB97FC1